MWNCVGKVILDPQLLALEGRGGGVELTKEFLAHFSTNLGGGIAICMVEVGGRGNLHGDLGSKC